MEEVIRTKDERGMFFHCLDPIIKTRLSKHPNPAPPDFYLLPPFNCKILDEIFPDPEVSILSPDIPDTERTGVRTVLCSRFVVI